MRKGKGAALTEAWPIGLRLRLDLLGLHGKIRNAQEGFAVFSNVRK